MSPQEEADETTSPLARPVAVPRWLSWERLAWIALVAVATVTRLHALGVRSMSHDESQHAVFSFQLYDAGIYRHEPVTHGPLLFHLNALVYLLLGDSDLTSRLMPALAGVGVVLTLWGFRRYVGRTGALVAGWLVALSPSLLFYSRYLRNDVYQALFFLLWTYAAFRYVESRKERWLHGMVVAMALAFVTKENSFIFGATIGTFFLARGVASARRADPGARVGFDLALLMLTLVLPFAASLLYLPLGWNPGSYGVPERQIGNLLLVSALALASLVVALLRFRRRSSERADGPGLWGWARLMASFWALQIFFFTTFFTNAPGGLASGVVGSLGYWLTQHEVARGGQPWFYYLLVGGLYEFLPLCLALAGAVSVARGLGDPTWRPVPTADLPPDRGGDADPGTADLARRGFPAFLAWWTLGSAIAYSVAGERMPWLLVHIALPASVLGGWWLGRTLSRTRARPEGDGRPASGWARLGRVAGLGAIGLLALVSVRASLMLTFRNFDQANELLVYAHGTPDIKAAVAEIEELSRRTVGGRDLAIAYDYQSSWPLTWYLRRFPNRRIYGPEPTLAAMRSPAVIVGPDNAARVKPHLIDAYARRAYRLLWWPPQDYAGLGFGDLLDLIRDPVSRGLLWRYLVDRRYPADPAAWPQRQEFDLYVKKDIAAAIWERETWSVSPEAGALQSVPRREIAVAAEYAGPYDGKPLRQPRDVAVSAAGLRVIADTGNDRIVILDRDGTFLGTFGSSCVLAEGAGGGCVDPDGEGPLELGDGQLNEPWGVAVDGEGRIHVADTWNGRIQVFDPGGRFLRKWGHLGAAQGPAADPESLYGPRDLTFDSTGSLLVSDTGNKRLLRFDADGAFLRQVGSAGITAGHFDEPVGLAVEREGGAVYVADAWNHRVQKLGPDLEYSGEWRVPAWRDEGALHKPYLATDARGRLYAGDPENARLLVFGPAGRIESALVGALVGRSSLENPTGLAWDGGANLLLVADAGNDRVLAIRVPDDAAPQPAASPGMR